MYRRLVPQIWWDSYRYTVSLGYAHGLADFMPRTAIALPVADMQIVSSSDAFRLSVSLPCLLGMSRKSMGGGKLMLTIPPSARVSWR